MNQLRGLHLAADFKAARRGRGNRRGRWRRRRGRSNCYRSKHSTDRSVRHSTRNASRHARERGRRSIILRRRVAKLLDAFERLLRSGGSILIIEHNLEVIRRADWVIDLGPEGGDRGGRIVAEGTPEQIAQVPESYTGQYLRK